MSSNAIPQLAPTCRHFGHFTRAERHTRSGFSLIELIVVMAVISILIALTLPAVTQIRETARKTQCVNNLHNLALAMTHFDIVHRRLPASGYYFDPPNGPGGSHHSWAVSLLPFIEQNNVYDNWDLDKPINDPANITLTEAHIPVYVCPLDLSRSEEKLGDLSYAVNGGWGFTIRTGNGVGDCPIDWHGRRLDLNGDGLTCTGTKSDDEDHYRFTQLGLFFLENWKVGGTERHHSLNQVVDGTSQTFLMSENVRAGYDPDDVRASFADPNPYRCAFYVGNPCPGGTCAPGTVDYSRSNSGSNRINSGLWSAEGKSPVPNSFHQGGVNMAFADGRVVFLNEAIDGRAYSALSSPRGMMLDDTPLEQAVVSGGEH